MGFEETTKFIDAKADIRDRISVEVGDSKQAKFYPQTKVSRWDNEVNLSVRLVHDEAAPIVIDGGDKVSWEGENQKVEFYEIGPSELHPEGATEIEVTLFERPADDRVQFTINTKGILFYRQPASVDELPEALRKAASPVIPEHIKGSFAVYAAEPKTNYEGGKAYKSGKVGHIYRPRMSDANGVEAWGELSIDTDSGLLTVDLDKDFLDKAVYPIRHAAGLTFGYTTVGGTALGLGTSTTVYDSATGGAGTATIISIYARTSDGSSRSIRAGLWKQSDNTLLTDSYAPAVTVASSTPAWKDMTYVTSPTTAAEGYYIAAMASANTLPECYCDFGSFSGGGGAAGTYSSPGNISPTDFDLRMSIYVTYDAVVGSLPTPFRTYQAIQRASTY